MKISFLVWAIGVMLGAVGMARAEENFVDSATPRNAQPAGAEGHWVLTFSDEFNAETLDPAKWNIDTKRRDKGNSDVSWGWKTANVSLNKKSGYAAIETRKDGENRFSSGCISTREKFAQRYGFFEVRMKPPPKKSGDQGAIWLMPEKVDGVGQMGAGKPGAEVDVVETHLAADKGTSTVHWNGYGEEHKSATKAWKAPGMYEEFHTYGVEWTPRFVRVYYDGKPVWTHEGKGVPTVAEYIICSAGILDWDAGDIRTAQLPHQTLFDWVRVYAKSENGNVPAKPRRPRQKPKQ